MSECRPSSEGDRLLELLADQAVFGLDPDEREQLEAMLAVAPDVDRECMEYAAAAVHLAGIGTELEPLPASLHRRIRASRQVIRRHSSEP